MRFKLTLVFLLALILGLMANGYMHEEVHRAIFSDYGVHSEVYYLKYFPRMVTVPNVTEAIEYCNESCNIQHEENEIVGYNIEGIYYIIGIGLFFIILLLEYRLDNKIDEIRRNEEDIYM